MTGRIRLPEGIREMPFDPNSIAILEAMIGAMAVVWAISAAVYAFIYEYFDRNYGHEAWSYAHGEEEPKGTQRVCQMLLRLYRNERTFSAFIVAGIAAFVSILVSLGVLFVGVDDALRVVVLFALIVFGVALFFFLYLFTHEIRTSIDQMRTYSEKILARLPPGKAPPESAPH